MPQGYVLGPLFLVLYSEELHFILENKLKINWSFPTATSKISILSEKHMDNHLQDT